MMRRSTFWSFVGTTALLAGVAGSFGGAASAATGTISMKADTNQYSFGGGGEFKVLTYTGPALTVPCAPAANVAGSVFQTFCLEKNVSFVQEQTYNWTSSGFINGNNATPLPEEVAYLYFHFWKGDLANYSLTLPRTTQAGNLQYAIWSFVGDFDINAAPGEAQAFYNEAQAAVANHTWSGLHGVQVLTLTEAVTGAAAQDVLVIAGETQPAIRLTKTADPAVADPFQPVTYSYLVENIGSVNLDNVIVTDDNGTPGDATDDFQLGPVSIAAGGSYTFGKTVIPPVLDLCATINNVPDTYAGTLVTQILANGDVKVTYIQSEVGTNDNRYGTGATAATGWPSGHKFGDLTGSDKCEFRFKDGNGTVVLDFFADYISSATSATFPSGTVNYPAKYGTLGCTGGDGSVVTGSSANVLSVHTSLSDCLNLPQFQALNLVNSPPETAPYSGVSTPLGWNYKDSYTVVIKASAFGANGFGSVEIPNQHNSPPKTGTTNALTPVPCETTVTNTAVVTATASGSGVTVTATDDATVLITGPSDGNTSKVVATITKFDKKKVNIAIKNTGTTTVAIGSLKLDWPAGNNGLKTIKRGATLLFDTLTPPTTVTVSTWKGNLSDRQIPKGGTKTYTFEFESNANTTKTNYHLSVDFGGGFVVLLP